MTGEQLMERDAEFAALDNVFDGVRDGTGRVILIEGSAGIGKSALLSRAAELARGRGFSILRARGGELERTHPFGLIRQLLEPAVRARDAGARAQLLSGAARPARRLLGLDDAGGPVTDVFAAAHAVFWVVAGLAAERPILIAVDDAHWGDGSSLRAIEHLARRIDDLPVALLVTLRPLEPGAPTALLDALRAAPGAARLAPAPLSCDAVTEIVRSRWPEVEETTAGAAHEATRGNPLLLIELLRALQTASEPPNAITVSAASIPTLEERVLRRAGRVAPEAARLAQAMSVLGDGVRLTTAADLAGIERTAASELALGLRRLEVLTTEDPVAFVHPLVLRSLYDGLAAPRRYALHRRAAELLAAEGADIEARAAHLAVLPAAESVTVATHQLRAAEAALERAAPEEAVAWIERGLAENASEPPRAVLLARLGLARTALRDPAAAPLLQEAYAGLRDPELRRRVAVELSYSLGVAGAWEEAAAVIERAEHDAVDGPQARADLAAVRATLERHDSRRLAGFTARHAELAQIAEGDGAGADAVAAVLAAAAVYDGDVAAARHQLSLARRDERLLRDPGAHGWAVPLLLMTPVLLDDMNTAQALIAEAETAGLVSASALHSLSARATDAWLRARRGDLVEAEADLNTLLDVSRESGMAMMTANVVQFLIDVLIERRSATATGDILEQMTVPPEFLPTWSGATLLEARGRLRLARGQQSGIADLRAAGETASSLGIGPLVSCWRSTLASALGAEDLREALVLVKAELELAERTGLARPQGVALRALGELSARDEGIVHLQKSVAILRRSPSRLELARSLIALGAALRRAGRRREARSTLDAGLQLARTCGADRLCAGAEEELAAAGGSRHRRGPVGTEALTPSETRVARLAAAGHSNVEIAQRLFVSVKTVETHLAHAYGKLGLSGAGSRWRLSTLLDPVSVNADESASP